MGKKGGTTVGDLEDIARGTGKDELKLTLDRSGRRRRDQAFDDWKYADAR